MRKILKIAVALAVIAGVSACSKTEETAVEKECVFETVLSNTTTVLNEEQLSEKINDKEDFILLISDSACQGCMNFKNGILESFLKETNIKVYEISSGVLEPKNEIIPWRTTPTLGMFVDGVLESKISDIDNESYFASVDNFEGWVMEKIENVNKFIRSGVEVNETKIEYLIETDEKMIIYFKRDTCGDCTYFNENYLKEATKISIDGGKDKTSLNQTRYYIFDINEHYLARDKELGAEDPEWQEFTAKYGLSDLDHNGSSKGWQTGVVPTFQFRSSGNIVESAVVYNDKVEFNEDYSELKVIDSFYSDSPFIDETFVKNEQESAYKKYQKDTLEFFAKKVEELFIDFRN